jgi:hypothetical protein
VTTYAPEVERPADAHAASAGRLDDRLFVACALAWAAGLLHAVAAFDHAPHPLALALLAAAQFGWGVTLYNRPGRGLLLAGALLSAGAAAAGIGSLTTLESVAVADEIALGLLAIAQLRPARTGRIARGARFAGMAASVYLILVSSLLLMPGSTQHGAKASLVGVPRAGLQLICHGG